MRILHISNFGDLRCGVAEWSRQLSATLRTLGHDVTDFDGCYPQCYARGYYPPDIATADVVHVTWSPITLNHYQPGTLPACPLSVFLMDLPPWSSCNLVAEARVVSAFEPHESVHVVLPPPCPTHRPTLPMATTPWIGRTGIRPYEDRVLEDICERHGWCLSSSDGWVSLDAEINRLALCWVNVLWYRESRSKSSAVSVAAAARRPLILSETSRFDHLWPWRDEYTWVSIEAPAVLEATLVAYVAAIAAGAGGALARPTASVEALAWPKVIAPLVAAWEGRR